MPEFTAPGSSTAPVQKTRAKYTGIYGTQPGIASPYQTQTPKTPTQAGGVTSAYRPPVASYGTPMSQQQAQRPGTAGAGGYDVGQGGQGGASSGAPSSYDTNSPEYQAYRQRAHEAGTGEGASHDARAAIGLAWGAPNISSEGMIAGLANQIPGTRINPYLEEGNPLVQGIQTDALSQNAQRLALRGLEERYAGGGMDATERANLAQMQMGNRQQERSQRQAIAQEMAARGLGSSGTALAGSLAAQQGAANRMSQEGLGIEAMAQQRRDQTLQQMAQQGAQMRGMSFQEDLARAQAGDERAQRNIGTLNQAQAANAGLAEQQYQDRAQIMDRLSADWARKLAGQQWQSQQPNAFEQVWDPAMQGLSVASGFIPGGGGGGK